MDDNSYWGRQQLKIPDMFAFQWLQCLQSQKNDPNYQGCVQSRKKFSFLVLGFVELSTFTPPYRVIKIVKRLQHLHIEKIF